MNNVITPENEKNVKKVLDDIFDNFNFERVKKTMDALDWTWWVGEGEQARIRIPTLDEIKEKAARLMWECANTDIDVIAMCGFRVEKDFTNEPWMRLSFEVTDWDASDLD